MGCEKAQETEGNIREEMVLFDKLGFYNDAEVTFLIERRKFLPDGLKGGEPGKTEKNNAWTNLFLYYLDVMRSETPGGGGYGKVQQ